MNQSATGTTQDLTHSKKFLIDNEFMKNIWLGDINAVQNAINKGIDINAQDEQFGFTPLMLATMIGDYDIVKLLLENRARTGITSHSNKTVLNYVSGNTDKRIAALLEEHWIAEKIMEKTRERVLSHRNTSFKKAVILQKSREY